VIDVIAIPQDSNPYQELLYAPMRARGARVRYAGELTASHTLNLLLLPLELAALRARGYRILHVHWTFGFRPAAARSRTARRAWRSWFELVLRVTRRLGLRLVWTAHNALPHAPVFDDDLAARRALVNAAAVTIGHSATALAELAALGLPATPSTVIPHGPLSARGVAELGPPRAAEPRTALLFGNLEPYKGAQELLAAYLAEPSLTGRLRLRIAGHCADAALAADLRAAADAAGDAVELRFGRVPELELAALLDSADVLVFPFRRVTTSGSVLLGMSSARPVVVPDLPAFRELPEQAVFRYRPGVDGLRAALRAVLAATPAELQAKGAAARAAAAGTSWVQIAALTQAAYGGALARSGSALLGEHRQDPDPVRQVIGHHAHGAVAAGAPRGNGQQQRVQREDDGHR
jgi:glycosyltransferase involved in cell wall biosynthesis